MPQIPEQEVPFGIAYPHRLKVDLRIYVPVRYHNVEKARIIEVGEGNAKAQRCAADFTQSRFKREIGEGAVSIVVI